MIKVLVLGFFGYITEQLDGQTVKTRNVYELLKAKEHLVNADVAYFDTQNFKKSRLSFLSMLCLLLRSDKVFYLGAQKNLKYIFPFIYFLCFVFRKDIHYIVVGGWLYDFLGNKPLHRYMLKRVASIHPETSVLCGQLSSVYGFCNTARLDNFRVLSGGGMPAVLAASKDVVRLVFMARVHPMKGVDRVFKLAEELKLSGINDVTVDIYGPIYKDYEEDFRGELIKFDGFLSYKGMLRPDEIHHVLLGYDLMLFPTRYYTEGFPGSILDSYLAGVPVVVSRWKYAEEFVEHDVSGVICSFDNDHEFVSAVLSIVNDSERLGALKAGARAMSLKYSSDAAWDKLKLVIESS